MLLVCLGISLLMGQPGSAQLPPAAPNVPQQPTLSFPPAQPHPLPQTLVDWQGNGDNYFDQVVPLEVGYLIWSEFPVRVYVDRHVKEGWEANAVQAWTTEVETAIAEWAAYFPLEQVEQADQADITIYRQAPPLELGDDGKPKRIRSAQTQFQLYIKRQPGEPATLVHRFKILLRPNQIGRYARAAARHELGHALGIWGHSSVETDALYFSQVRQPQPISPRDINTLKQIYQQPTKLGWPLPDSTLP